MERLDKFLCDSGAGTRSQVKQILKSGRVTVDGKTERDNSRKIDPQCNTVCLDGEVLGGSRRVVIMLNKPSGFVTHLLYSIRTYHIFLVVLYSINPPSFLFN